MKQRLGIVIIVILFVLWSIRVISLNRYYQETDAVPEINAGIGEYVSFGMNYSYGEWPNSYSIRADDYQIMDTEDCLEQHHAKKEDYPYSYEKVCIADVTVRYDIPDETSDRDTEGLYLTGYPEQKNIVLQE